MRNEKVSGPPRTNKPAGKLPKEKKEKAKKVDVQRHSANATVLDQLGNSKAAEVPRAPISVRLTKGQEEKAELTRDDLTVEQIKAQRQELVRLGVPPLNVPSKATDPRQPPTGVQARGPATSPRQLGGTKDSARRVLPEARSLVSKRETPGHLREQDSPRPVSVKREIPTAMGRGSAVERLARMDHKLNIMRIEADSLERLLTAKTTAIKTLQEKRDREAAALYQSPRSKQSVSVQGEEASPLDEIDSMIENW